MKWVMYVSKTLKTLSNDQLRALADLSTINNEIIGITGYLYFNKNRFLQYMEGSEKEIDNLLDKIKQDSRHELTILIEENQKMRRRFPNWSMKNIAELMPDNTIIETTIIQTMSIFGENELTISTRNQNELFKLMDNLSLALLK